MYCSLVTVATIHGQISIYVFMYNMHFLFYNLLHEKYMYMYSTING